MNKKAREAENVTSSEKEKLQEFFEAINWKVGNSLLYEQALTHSSYAHEKGIRNGHNERLEFLGDAVLELIISDYLYQSYPQLSEGKLTKLRADLVCEASLAKLAFSLDLGSYLRLGKGEAAGGGHSRPSLLSDTVEALIGALFLDRGLEKCKQYVLRLYEPIFNDLGEGVLQRDFKTLLQEYAQARFTITPEYRIVNESGPDHDKLFEAAVYMGSNPVGKGSGRTKKEAEQAAAREAWYILVH